MIVCSIYSKSREKAAILFINILVVLKYFNTQLITALNLDPNQAKYYAHLGYNLSEQGDSVKGYSYLLHSLKIDPENLLYKKWWAISLSSVRFTKINPDVVTQIIDCFQEPSINKKNLLFPS